MQCKKSIHTYLPTLAERLGCKMPSSYFNRLEDELELMGEEDEEDDDEFMVKSIFRSKREDDTVASSVANKKQLREMLGEDFFD